MLDIICLLSMILYMTGKCSENLALRKPTAMSSLGGTCYSYHAVDGNTGTDIDVDLCTHTTGEESQPWWMVDLHGSYFVNRVLLTNRGDGCYPRLHSFVIEIFEQNPQHCSRAISQVCFNSTGAPVGQGETKTFTCQKSIRGRFVRVKKWKVNSGSDVLTLCEVQIFSDSETGCNFPVQLQRTEKTRLRSSPVKLIADMTPVTCATQCARKSKCLAFNFNVNSHQCELILNPMFNDTMEFQSAWNYYGSDLC